MPTENVEDTSEEEISQAEWLAQLGREPFECASCAIVETQENNTHWEHTRMANDHNVVATVCQDCHDTFSECFECGRLIDTENDHDYNCMDHGYICERCTSRSYHYCDGCEQYIRDGEECGHEDEDEDDREYDCQEEQEDYAVNSQLNGYNFKPTTKYFWSIVNGVPNSETVADDSLFFGIEIETQSTLDSIRSGVQCFHDNVSNTVGYVKRDGSVSDGMEINTHPMTLDYIYDEFFSDTLEQLVSLGWRAWKQSSCGIHVHLSKRAFASTTHKARFQLFIMRNEQQMVRFARRRSPSYAKFSDDEESQFIDRAKGNPNHDRFCAVNWQPDETVELRIFRSTIKPSGVIGIVEMAHALFHFTKQSTCRMMYDGLFTWDAFVEWVDTQEYKYLSERIARYVTAPNANTLARLDNDGETLEVAI